MINRMLRKQIYIAVALCVALLASITFQQSAFAQSDVSTSDYVVVQDDSSKLVIKNKVDTNKNFRMMRTSTEEVHATIEMDKRSQEITLNTDEASTITGKNEKRYNVIIDDVTGEDDDIKARFIDVETNEVFNVNTGTVTASFAFLIPLGVIIGTALIEHLISIALAVTIGGIAWAVVTEIRANLREKEYDHYMAKIMQGNVWVGDALDLGSAAYRLTNPFLDWQNNNVWSRTSAAAALVAYTAGNGNTPVGPELTIDKSGGSIMFFYSHYHTWNRAGGHSFF